MSLTIQSVLKAHFVDALARRVCGDNYEVLHRQAAFVVKNPVEEGRDVHRLIILHPKGYTANTPDQMNSHDEAEFATIDLKGGVREGKNGFSTLRNSLLVASKPQNGKSSDLNQPYLTYNLDVDDPDLETVLHSAGESPFSVVKSNGYGFYHNLVNTTDDWLVMVLHKRLRPSKGVDLQSALRPLQTEHAQTFGALYEGIVEHGDQIFNKDPKLVEAVKKIPLANALPVLSEMLYVHDSGMHEACTVFAIILDMGKKSPEEAKKLLHDTLEIKAIPEYYANQLLQKITKYQSANTAESLKEKRRYEL